MRKTPKKVSNNVSVVNNYSLLRDDFDCLFELYETDYACFEKVKENIEEVQRHQYFLNKRFHFRFEQAQEVLDKSRLLIESHRKFFKNIPTPLESITRTIESIIEQPDPKVVKSNEDQIEDDPTLKEEEDRQCKVVSDFSEFKENLSEYYERMEVELVKDFQNFKSYLEEEYPPRVKNFRNLLQDIHSQVKEMSEAFHNYTSNSQLILKEIEQKVVYQKQLVSDLKRLLDQRRNDDDEEVEDEGEDLDDLDEYSMLLLGGTYHGDEVEEEEFEEINEDEINFRKLIRTKHDEIQSLSNQLALNGSVFIQKNLQPQESLLVDLQQVVIEFTDSLEPYFEIPYHLKFFVSIGSVYETVLEERKRRKEFVKEYQSHLLERHQIDDDVDLNHLWSVFVPLLRIPNEVIILSSQQQQQKVCLEIRNTDEVEEVGHKEEEDQGRDDDSTATATTTVTSTYTSNSEENNRNSNNISPNLILNARNHHQNRVNNNDLYFRISPGQQRQLNIPTTLSDVHHSETESDVHSVSDIETYMTAILSKKKSIGIQTLPDISTAARSKVMSSQVHPLPSPNRPALIWKGKKGMGIEQKGEEDENEGESSNGYDDGFDNKLDIMNQKNKCPGQDEGLMMEIRRRLGKLAKDKENLEQRLRDRDQEKKRHMYHLSRISCENMKLRRQLNKMSNSENLHLVQLKKKVFLLQKKFREASSMMRHNQAQNNNNNQAHSILPFTIEEEKKVTRQQQNVKFYGRLEIGDLVLCKKEKKSGSWKIVHESEDEYDEYFISAENRERIDGFHLFEKHKILYGVIGDIYAKKREVHVFGDDRKKVKKNILVKFVKEVRLEKLIVPN